MFKCPYPGCNKLFKTISNLKKHYASSHYSLTCEVCGKVFRGFQGKVKHQSMMFMKGDLKHGVFYYLNSSENPKTKMKRSDARKVSLTLLVFNGDG